jgi:general secretion pathway protein K
MRHTQQQRGAALIIVLGLVALIAGWAANAAYEDMLSLRRAENQQLSTTAELASLSALKLARLALESDAKNSQTDNLEEDWALPPTPFPLDDGLVMGQLEDSNRFYNLNDLVTDQGVADNYSVSEVKRLFTMLELNPSLVDALVDWMDKDDLPSGPGGAEAEAYYGKPYSVKNARLDRWNELRMVAGFEPAVVHALQGIAIVRPVYAGVKTLVNINTADKRVLLMLFPQMTDADADAFITARPYADVTTITTQPWAAGGNITRLSVSSDMFILHTQAIFGHVDWKEDYLLARQGGKISLRWRERNIWQP